MSQSRDDQKVVSSASTSDQRLIITTYGTVVSCVVAYEYMFVLVVIYNRHCTPATTRRLSTICTYLDVQNG